MGVSCFILVCDKVRYKELVLDASSRPSFRSTLSQPSQMGNFKHQSLRSGDRERDGDRDRDREIRDKEGLRHVGISRF